MKEMAAAQAVLLEENTVVKNVKKAGTKYPQMEIR
jgi:hypothetical protein